MMLARQQDRREGSYACNDNGRLSASWNNPSILAVAGRSGFTVSLTYIADGVYIISMPAVDR
jgi:hypothetical protein